MPYFGICESKSKQSVDGCLKFNALSIFLQILQVINILSRKRGYRYPVPVLTSQHLQDSIRQHVLSRNRTCQKRKQQERQSNQLIQ